MSYYHVAEIGLYPARKYAYDTNGNLTYQGFAVAGANPSESNWAIMKFSYDSSDNLLSTKFPDGKSSYEYCWNNREIYTYE